MEFILHEPPPHLADSVQAIWCARGTREEFATPEPIVPDGCVEIIFNLADPFRNGEVQPLALLAGQMTGPVVAVPTGAVDLIGVRFRPGRAGAALRTPIWELQDQLIDASSVMHRADRLIDDLRDLRNGARLDHLCNELAHRVRARQPRSLEIVEQAIEMIQARGGNIGIDRLARTIGITRRHLERRFRDEVGLSAKQLARIARVQSVLRLIHAQPLLSGAEIAAHCGYSDQPHMIRECKAIAGQTPARLMTTERSLAGLMRGAA